MKYNENCIWYVDNTMVLFTSFVCLNNMRFYFVAFFAACHVTTPTLIDVNMRVILPAFIYNSGIKQGI